MGFEAIANGPDSIENPQISAEGAAKASVAVSPPMPANADLQAIRDAWTVLPDAIKAGILAMVNAASRTSRHEPDGHTQEVNKHE